MEENVCNNKENSRKNKILTVVSIVFILGVIVTLILYGGDFVKNLSDFLAKNAKNKSPYLIFLGYLFVFIGTIVEGEGVLFLSVLGLCGTFHLITLPGIIIAGAIGGSTGDNLYFHFFRKSSTDKLLAKSRKLKKLYPKVQGMVKKYGVWTVVVSRFLFGLRNCVALVCATGNMPPARFAFLNFISAILWSTFFSCAIYYGGEEFQKYFDVFKKIWPVILGVLIIAIIIMFVFKKKEPDEEAAGNEA